MWFLLGLVSLICLGINHHFNTRAELIKNTSDMREFSSHIRIKFNNFLAFLFGGGFYVFLIWAIINGIGAFFSDDKTEVATKTNNESAVTKEVKAANNSQIDVCPQTGKDKIDTESLYCSYHKNGKLNVEVPKRNGKWEGLAKSYYESGKLESETPFKNGQEEGLAKSYYEKNGSVECKTPYKNGKIHGLEKCYLPHNSIAIFADWETEYEDGIRKPKNNCDSSFWCTLGTAILETR